MDALPEAYERAFRDGRLAGRLERPTGTGRAANEVCGDVVEFDVRVEEGGVQAVRFRAAGCLAALAAAAYLAERAAGRALGEVAALEADAIEREAGRLPPARRHGLLLALRALHQALEAGAYGQGEGRGSA